ncbi:MAG: hypothetical protein WCT49_01770 [Candidatus Paceibacterota bacterium]|nr:hypothetical protein [Candidatus Paceibacterota bacterium]
MELEGESDGDFELEGEVLELGESEGLFELDGEVEELGESDGLLELDGDVDADGLKLGDPKEKYATAIPHSYKRVR